MLKVIRNILCFIGFHKWRQNRKLHPADYIPSHSIHETPKRECINCGKKQVWVIGSGAGELGHWESIKTNEHGLSIH